MASRFLHQLPMALRAFRTQVRQPLHPSCVRLRRRVHGLLAAGGFSVQVTDRCMYSHTLQFGNSEPFRTGCTAVVRAGLHGPDLGPDGVLVDIDVVRQLLREILAGYDHRDLGLLPEFAGLNTTVEVVARAVHGSLLAGLREHRKQTAAAGEPESMGRITRLEVLVRESDIASAGYFEEDPEGLVRE
mmetsp:Transcript_10027/g.29958  ORF Transcript_10027/g.29958 Transcript_10027/m.29958 type:complete len:187 (-) Transcript_10027:41-601(-)